MVSVTIVSIVVAVHCDGASVASAVMLDVQRGGRGKEEGVVGRYDGFVLLGFLNAFLSQCPYEEV